VIDTTLLEAACEYVGKGLPVFPCDGKLPRTPHGFKDATTDVARVLSWWRRWPDAAIAIPTGSVSGLVAVDVDLRHGGTQTLEQLRRQYGAWEKGPKALTGSGGQHLFFAYQDGLRNSAGALGPGLDVRGEGGYVIVAPSVHESGKPYKWLHPLNGQLPEAPTWLLAQTERRTGDGCSAASALIPEGERDVTLASLAGSMRRRGMTEAEILVALREVNAARCRPPLSDADVERIARSVGRYAPAASGGAEAAPPLSLQIVTARAIRELPDPPRSDELLGPLLIRGQRVVLGGHTGEGKTTLGLQLVRAVVLEQDFLGWSGAGGRALVLDAEQGLRSVKRRLREAGLHDSDLIDYVRVPDGLELNANEQHVAEVARILEAGQYALVCADPLYKLHTGDSNAEREAVDLMRRFDTWREEYGFGLVLPVHCRKPLPGTKFTIHDLFGSSAYLRGAEVVLGLQRVGDGYSRLHWLKDRDGDLPIGTAWGLLFDRESGFRRDPNDGRKPTARERVKELLEEDRELSTAQLVEITGFAERTVRKAVHDLDEGQLEL
jgi:Bifunctional DNA primase/polymerase, N-terminal/AAA domain/Primase C terminal 1 (PriCT-1)